MNKWFAVLSFLAFLQVSDAQSFTVKTKTAIDNFLKLTYPNSLPGAAVTFGEYKSFYFEKCYGVRDNNTKEKNSELTTFNIASLTKQFTAMAILQLEEKGSLSLSDKLSRFLPEMNKTIGDSITIQQLLTHTSGIRDHYEYINTSGMQHAYNIDVYNAIKKVDSLYFAAGKQFRYSNTGYCLLALVIEKVSGLSFNNYMQRYIFAPAGMIFTTIWNEKAHIPLPAIGYDRDSATHQFIASGANEHIFFSTEGDGGIYTSLFDYQRWLFALNKGKIFSKKMIEKARSIEYTINAERKLGYGFGWFADESESYKKVFHSGSNGGFRTYSFTIPQQGFFIVIFSNRSDVDVEEVAEKIYHLLYPNAKPFVKIEALTS